MRVSFSNFPPKFSLQKQSFMSHKSSVIFEKHEANVSFKSKAICSIWHNQYPLLAVSTANGVVSCYDDEGDRKDEVNLSRSCICTVIAWHPIEKILCTGWKDGELHVYNHKEQSAKAVSQGNNDISHLGNIITALRWTPDGTRMITADTAGVIGIWELNSRGKISIIAFHNTLKRATQLTNDQITFKKARVNLNNKDEQNGPIEYWIFFFTGNSGKLFMVDDTGKMASIIVLQKNQMLTLFFIR